MNFTEKLKIIDNGRFFDLIESMNVMTICEHCGWWTGTQTAQNTYRCKVSPACIAATVHPKLQEYFKKKLDPVTFAVELQQGGRRSVCCNAPLVKRVVQGDKKPYPRYRCKKCNSDQGE